MTNTPSYIRYICHIDSCPTSYIEVLSSLSHESLEEHIKEYHSIIINTQGAEQYPKYLKVHLYRNNYKIIPVLCAECKINKNTLKDGISVCNCKAVEYCQGCFTPVCFGCLMDYHTEHHFENERNLWGVNSILDIIGKNFQDPVEKEQIRIKRTIKKI